MNIDQALLEPALQHGDAAGQSRDEMPRAEAAAATPPGSADHLFDLLQRREPLLRELERYVYTYGSFRVLKHPLVASVPYSEQQNAYLNFALGVKRQAVRVALQERNVMRYVTMHERPDRIDAIWKFLTVVRDFGRDAAELKDFWSCVAYAHMDSECIDQCLPKWLRLWTKAKPHLLPHRHLAMSAKDRTRLDALPNLIECWHGGDSDACADLSWTIDRKKAEWFARRFKCRTPTVLTGLVRKADVIALLGGRGESELVVDPRNAKITSVDRL